MTRVVMCFVALMLPAMAWGQSIDGDSRPVFGPGDVAAGGARSVLARPDGQALEWLRDTAPGPVMSLSQVVSVAVGQAHALAATASGDVFAWGRNDAGQLGDGTHAKRKSPLRVPGLSNVMRVAAGRAHSMALSADGRVWVWGSNHHGQLGLTTTKKTLGPTLISSLSDVVAIDAGDAHSVAVTRSGQVFAWGSNMHGQLGDGTRRLRRTPTAIALADIIDVAAGATHSLALARNGGVYSWGSGTRGELGTGSLSTEPHPLPIASLRASAIRAGRRFSAAVRRDGVLLLWGANDAGQLGDGTLIDRPTPVSGPAITSISALALGSRHGIAVTASGDVWTWGHNEALSNTISDVPDWGPPFVPEKLSVPLILPASGAYPAPQLVTLSSPDQDVVLRYTTDGSDPTGESAVYSEPFIVAATSTVKVRAYASRPEVDPSDIASASYTIDMSPPVIHAEVSPTLSGTTWFTTPVTVRFHCTDDSGVVSCPAPMVVSSDGAAQLISGTAIDPAGNRATTSVTISLDRTPPMVVLDDSVDGSTTTATTVVLNGRVFDLTSGLANAFRCNGNAVPIQQDAFTCVVALRPGLNSITLQAEDLAGHTMAAGIVVRRVGDSTTIAIAPHSRTMALDEVAPLSLTDEFGAAVAGAAWSSSDVTVAALSDDDPPLLTALSPGTVTIRATKNGLSAEATATIQALQVLAPGTTRWTIAPVPGLTMQQPIFTHRVEPEVPEMFVVESVTPAEATLRAVTAEGEVLWKQESPGLPLMGDSFGGVIAGVTQPYSYDFFRALVRLGNAGGVRPWRYESRGSLLRPAQAPDGTLYAIEYVPWFDANGEELWDKHVVVIDGTSGRLLARHVLAREVQTFTAELDGVVVRERPRLVCRSSSFAQAPSTLGPIVGSDGRGYLLVRRLVKHKFDTCIEQHSRHRRTIDMGIDLVMLSRDDTPVVQPVFADNCDIPVFQVASCDVTPELKQLLPDGIGGMMASWDEFGSFLSTNVVMLQRVVSRRDDQGHLVATAVDNTTWIGTVGQAGISYVFASGAWSAVDVTSWTSKWTSSLGTFGPLAAHPEGGAALYDWFNGVLRIVKEDGQPDGDTPLSLGFRGHLVQHQGNWIGVKDGQLHAVSGDFPDATRFSFAGNAQLQLAVRNPGVGIFLKSHWAFQGVEFFKHLSIRIVPRHQAFWRAFDPSGFLPRDVFGNHFMTMGAGTGPDDTSVACSGTLTKGINRDRDVLEKPSSLDAYAIAPDQENARIQSLLDGFNNYANSLPYACFPERNPGSYNSNSFARGLQDAAGLPPASLRPGIIAPGWFTPVPQQYFRPQ